MEPHRLTVTALEENLPITVTVAQSQIVFHGANNPCNKVTSPVRSLLPSPVCDLNSEVPLYCIVLLDIGNMNRIKGCSHSVWDVLLFCVSFCRGQLTQSSGLSESTSPLPAALRKTSLSPTCDPTSSHGHLHPTQGASSPQKIAQRKINKVLRWIEIGLQV